jgi:hypothetical protein
MKRPSTPLTVSLVALFFSLTGAGLAASRYIITNTHQIKPNVLRALRGQRGPAGIDGAQGPPGAAGTFAATNITAVQGPDETVCAFGGGSCGIASSIVACTTGTAIAGGWTGSVVNGAVAINQPLSGNRWVVTVVNNGSVAGDFSAYVICAA